MHQFKILRFMDTFSNEDSPKLKVNFRIVIAPMGEGPGETHKGLSMSVRGSRTQEVLTELPETRTMEKTLIDYIDVEQQLGLSLFSKGKEQIGSKGAFTMRGDRTKNRPTKGYMPCRGGGWGKGEVQLQKQKTSQAGQSMMGLGNWAHHKQ